MIFLIFPKYFEYYKFQFELIKNGLFRIKVHYQNFDILFLRIKGENFALCTKLIDASDIDFLFKFNEFSDKLPEGDFKFMIFGTCGGIHPIGQAFHCTAAKKIDRGIWSNTGFQIRSDKVLSVSLEYDSGSTILSGNSLCTMDEMTFKSLFQSVPNSGILDMETFDFLKICQNKGLKCHGAIRVVSDKFNGQNCKFDRLTVDFTQGLDLLILEITSEGQISMCESIIKRLFVEDLFCFFKLNLTSLGILIRNADFVVNPKHQEAQVSAVVSSMRSLFQKYIDELERIPVSLASSSTAQSDLDQKRERIEKYLTFTISYTEFRVFQQKLEEHKNQRIEQIKAEGGLEFDDALSKPMGSRQKRPRVYDSDF